MHYSTPRIGFLETADAFLALFPEISQAPSAAFDMATLLLLA